MTDLTHPENLLDVCQRIADARQPSRAASAPQHLDEFRCRFERVMECLEADAAADLKGRKPSEDLMHEWSLFIAQGQDFLAALAAEIERSK